MYMQLPFSLKRLIEQVTTALMESHNRQWSTDLNRVIAVSGNGRNKLRTYRTFKDTYIVEHYCKMNLPYPHRSAFSKFRCGVAPIRLETGRYENLAEPQRICPICFIDVESELHVLLKCPVYVQERQILFDKARKVNLNFDTINDIEKLKFLFSNPDMIRITAKTCCNMLTTRNNTLYSKSLAVT